MKNYDYFDRKQILCDGMFVGTLNYKPFGAMVLIAAIGVGLILLKTKVAVIVGICFLAFGILSFFLLKDRKVLDLYTDALVVYDPTDNEKAFKLEYEDLDHWSVDSASRSIVFALKDERSFTVSCPRYVRAYNLLLKAAPDKKERSGLEKYKNRK